MPERLNRLESILSGKGRDFAFRLHASLPRRKSFPASCIALGLLLISVALKLLIDGSSGGRLPPFIFLYPAVVLAALVAGVRTGILMAALSILIAWLWFFPPFSSFELNSPMATLSLEIYAVSVILLGITVGFARYVLDLAIATEEMRDYDAQEAVHRIKNLLAVVQAIIVGSQRDTEGIEEYRGLISKRLSALAEAQDVLRTREEAAVTVGDLAQAALRPFMPNSQITIDCAAGVLIPTRYVHGLTLALFELATNSAKYGALSRNEGAITLHCEKAADKVMLKWCETVPQGHPEALSFQSNEGFGRKLIQVALRSDEGTAVSHQQDRQGIHATFEWRE